MADSDRTERRYFRDPHGVTWRVHTEGLVRRWSPDLACWSESQYRLTDLVEDPEIREVTEDEGLSAVPAVPARHVEAEIIRTWRTGMTAGAVNRAVQASRMDRETAQQYVTNLVAGRQVVVGDQPSFFDAMLVAARNLTGRVTS